MAGNITLNFEPVRDALFDWINKSINKASFNATTQDIETIAEGSTDAIPIHRAETNYVRPNRPFVEYKFLTGLLGIGQVDELVFDEAQDKFKLLGRREFTVSVTAIGKLNEDNEVIRPDVQECIAQIQQGLDSPVICQGLRAAGLAVRDANTVADATVFQEEADEPRNVLDVRFGITLENFDIVDGLERIENVQLRNKIVDPAAAGPYTVTIAKP